MTNVRRFHIGAALVIGIIIVYTAVGIRSRRYEVLVYNLTDKCADCSTLTVNDLEIISRGRTFPNGVPRIIHYNYKSRLVPSQYGPLVHHCVVLNPNVTFVLWSDLSSYNFIKFHFPHHFEIFRTYYQRKADPLKKSDVIRYFILLFFGGIYMDLDTRCQKPVEVAMNVASCILSREVEVQTRIVYNYPFLAMNSFMACLPNHTFFNYLTTNIVSDNSNGILELTGPKFLTASFKKYRRLLTTEDFKDPFKMVSVSSSALFSPYFENYIRGMCESPKGKWVVIGCRDLKEYSKSVKGMVSQAVVVHLFYHLGYSPQFKKIKTLTDLGNFTRINILI